MDLYEEMFAEMRERTKNSGIRTIVETNERKLPSPKSTNDILNLIFRMDDGDELTFAYPDANATHGVFVVKKTNGVDSYWEAGTWSHNEGVEKQVFDSQEEEELTKFVNEYSDLIIRSYINVSVQDAVDHRTGKTLKSIYRNMPREDDEQALGDYEMYGPDYPRHQY